MRMDAKSKVIITGNREQIISDDEIFRGVKSTKQQQNYKQ